MTDWTSGYVSDLGYAAKFYRETAPSHMAFAALSAGRSPGQALHPRGVLELGFGQGFGLALLAAANPNVAFEGCDFNPEHVAHIRRLIQGAGLSNLTVSESSFEESADRISDNNVDVLVLHGVMSWVSPNVQEAITAIARQRLQPEGLLYVSYNCMPGWAPVVPIRQFMLDVKRRYPGRASGTRVALALDLITKLRDGGALYFRANPSAMEHLNTLLKHDHSYVAHEYLNDHWNVFQFADIVSKLGAAKLSFVCSATLAENMDQCTLRKELLPAISALDDPVMREMLRDYAINKWFRRDVFARGAAALNTAEHRRLLSELRFVMTVPRRSVSLKFALPLGEMTGSEALYLPIVDLLDNKIADFAELLALPCFEGNVRVLLECLTILVHSGQVLPIVSPIPDMEPAQRFNRLVVDNAKLGRFYNALAVPVAGTGIGVPELWLFALAALFDGEGQTPEAAAQYALKLLKNNGRRPSRNGKVLETDAEALTFMEQYLKSFLEETVPVWRRLGIL